MFDGYVTMFVSTESCSINFFFNYSLPNVKREDRRFWEMTKVELFFGVLPESIMLPYPPTIEVLPCSTAFLSRYKKTKLMTKIFVLKMVFFFG